MKSLVCTCALFLLVSTVCVLAQTTNGSIQGTVTDPSGATIGGAKVTGRNLDTGLTISTMTTRCRALFIGEPPAGPVHRYCRRPNLKKYTREGVTVQTDATVALDIQMQIGAVSDNVTVTADAKQLETATSDIGVTLQSSSDRRTCRWRSPGTVRNPVEFIKLVPGFVGSVGNDPGNNSTDDFKVNGGQEGGTDMLVDGVSISLVSPNIQWNKGVSTEGVQEFKVLQSNFSPEYGESGDGIVSLTMKSGTNDWHGSVYDILRNRMLDANSWANNTQGLGKTSQYPKRLRRHCRRPGAHSLPLQRARQNLLLL